VKEKHLIPADLGNNLIGPHFLSIFLYRTIGTDSNAVKTVAAELHISSKGLLLQCKRFSRTCLNTRSAAPAAAFQISPLGLGFQ
jgi:hypothetical protein